MSRCTHPMATHYACDCQLERIARLEAEVAYWKEAYETIGRDNQQLEDENSRLGSILDWFIQHLSEHPSNWTDDEYEKMMDAAREELDGHTA